jgi:hypothetical protein
VGLLGPGSRRDSIFFLFGRVEIITAVSQPCTNVDIVISREGIGARISRREYDDSSGVFFGSN